MGNTMEQLRESAPHEINEADIRAELELALKEEARPLTRIAPEVGIAYGTLTSWKGGTYAGNGQRIAVAVQAWLNSRIARARAKAALPAEPDFILTRTASRIWDVCEFAQTTPTIGVVVGGSGVGKSIAFQSYRKQLPNTVWIATMEPYHTTIFNMLREIAGALDLAVAGRSFELVHKIAHRMRDTRGLLIVDEAQHLAAQLLDQLRSVAHSAGIGMVLGGNRQLMANLGADRRQEQLSQIYSRIGMKLHLRAVTRDDVAQLLDAWGLEGKEERSAATAIALKPGGARVMTHCLRVAFALAHAEAAEKPAVQHIEAAWAQFSAEAAA